ncbi:alpha/beta-hydrolase family protein [Mycolicibacillus parakoreensis]|uniref:Alpha/beta hydrolase n=2 Tax=Mycobacteriaceae TaxID=1762 RepID=A0ABY3U009_9MYCO|nr:alpha/beta hydrolase [Mycolicibacillus parakoreensis]MCV7314349.1 alpha/beta-hydrolase family protein [Mycolicibacillus parakoreensis]ULN53303.1 alpha/beta hydrolase [Mycolicibacillus parakoreensis]
MSTPADGLRRHPLLVWAWRLLRLHFAGVAFGALLFCLSLTPSLLPRDWMFQGLIGGINAAIGYALGVAVAAVVHRLVLRNAAWWPPPPRVAWGLKAVVVVGAPVACVAMVIPAAAWQRQVSALMELPGPTTVGYLRTLLVAAAVAAALVAVARVILDVIKLVARLLIRRWRLHTEVAMFIGTAIVVVLLVALFNGVLVRGFFVGANAMFEPQNSATDAGVDQPRSPQRSGSPASLVAWDSLGRQGRNFVAGGLHAAQLTRLNGAPAKEPIRVYAGLHSADDDAERMALLIGELERTGAAERGLLVIVPTTGTGWINPVAADSVEMMYNGDTAIVGVQYSYLPSWISFLGDEEKSLAAGRMLIQTVRTWWTRLPAGHRPKLALYGESLGALAGQGAFGWLPEITDSGFDAVLWVGPPHASRLWRELLARRDPGTTAVAPRYDDGRTVRFSTASDPAVIAATAAPPWPGTRVLFLQHPSDPVVWWSPDLLFSEPDWLAEPPGSDRTASMRWYPIVTFWQVAFDITNGEGAPPDHGHNYGDSVLDGWVAVLAPPNWRGADTERLRAALHDDAAAAVP